MDNNDYDEDKEFTSNFTDKTSYYFNTTKGAYDLDAMIIKFDPYMAKNLFLQLKCNIFIYKILSSLHLYEITSFLNYSAI